MRTPLVVPAIHRRTARRASTKLGPRSSGWRQPGGERCTFMSPEGRDRGRGMPMSTGAREGQRTFLPPAGYNWQPLYDFLAKLIETEAAHRQLVAQADIEPTHHVLDIGCGTGNLTLLVKRLHPRAEVVGFDPDA